MILLSLGLLLLCTTTVSRRDSCSVFERAGGLSQCVPIKSCPMLYSKISSFSNIKDKIRHLQSITCGFENKEPKVCCQKLEMGRMKQMMMKGSGVSFGKSMLPTLKECGRTSIGPVKTVLTNYVLGGRPTEIGEFPWVARIGYRDTENPEIDYICGGTLISKKFVLTTAHCILSHNPSNYEVRLGEHDTRIDPEFAPVLNKYSHVKDFKVKEIICHRDYNKATKHNDIALIQLAENVEFSEFIRPICLPFCEKYNLTKSDFEFSKEATVTGFGKTGNNPNNTGSEILQALEIPIVSNDKCQKIHEGKVTISSTQLCAGGVAGKDSCDGDSGGGLFVKNEKTKRHFQIGIVSFGHKICGFNGLPGIYTRTSSYLDWIIESMTQNSRKLILL